MSTLAEKAAEARSWLHRGEREVPGIGQILLPKPGAPGWLQPMCLSAHEDGDMLPDDWRYEFIGDALDVLAEPDDRDPRERFDEWADGAYIYTHEQLSWLASNLNRLGYCDEACEQYGDTLEWDTQRRIIAGMRHEQELVFESILASLEALVEEEEEAAEA